MPWQKPKEINKPQELLSRQSSSEEPVEFHPQFSSGVVAGDGLCRSIMHSVHGSVHHVSWRHVSSFILSFHRELYLPMLSYHILFLSLVYLSIFFFFVTPVFISGVSL